MKKRLFLDLDGTLAEWKSVSVDELYQEGYFYNLKGQANLIQAVKAVSKNCREWLELYILSCYLPKSVFALEEKAKWCRKMLPEIPLTNYIFVPFGKHKESYVPGVVRIDDVLLDDYTLNLLSWQGKGIKCLNGVNHSRKTWKGRCIDISWTSEKIADRLTKACEE